MSRPTLEDRQRHFLARAVLEFYLDADRSYWLRRAEAFAAVGTPACDEIAIACRNRADLGQDIATQELYDAMLAISVPMGITPGEDTWTMPTGFPASEDPWAAA